MSENHDEAPAIPWETFIAPCGHEDAFGYFANVSCKKCADKGHAKVMGRHE